MKICASQIHARTETFVYRQMTLTIVVVLARMEALARKQVESFIVYVHVVSLESIAKVSRGMNRPPVFKEHYIAAYQFCHHRAF